METESAKVDVVQRVSEVSRSLVRSVSYEIREKMASRDSARQRLIGAGVRACQAYFGLVLLAALAYALVTEPGNFSYDFSLVHSFATAALSAVSIWLLQKQLQCFIFKRKFSFLGPLEYF